MGELLNLGLLVPVGLWCVLHGGVDVIPVCVVDRPRRQIRVVPKSGFSSVLELVTSAMPTHDTAHRVPHSVFTEQVGDDVARCVLVGHGQDSTAGPTTRPMTHLNAAEVAAKGRFPRSGSAGVWNRGKTNACHCG